MKIAVIGGGPAGMMASAYASLSGANVYLIEKNDRLGKKLAITGKGRCNITNACEIREFISSIPVNGKFMHSAFYAFSNDDITALLSRYGVEVKTERGGRIFPKSDQAKDVIQALKRFVKDAGVKALHANVTDILKTENGFRVVTDHGKQNFDRVIIATGGASYPQTGSTGDGYRFARHLGHTVISPKPSLVPLTIAGKLPSQLMGLSLRNTAISIKDQKEKTVYTDFGEMLFTHYGVSGPMILSASAHLRDFSQNRYKLFIDFKPALDVQTLDQRILRDFAQNQNRDFRNSLDALLPKKLIPVIVDLSKIPPEQKVRDITKEQRQNLVHLLKAFPLTITGTRPIAEAIITSGGINVKEINPKTMESKIVPGLYFAGEIIDVDAYTGGFNLQIAYSTGYVAGIHAGEEQW